MSKKQNKFSFQSEETRAKYINDIINFFQNERGEEIGYIAAEEMLEFFLQTFGEEIYRKAIKDSKRLLKERIEDLEVELDVLSAGE